MCACGSSRRARRDRGRLDDGVVGVAGGLFGERAGVVDADGLQLGTLGLDDGRGRRASGAEERVQGHADGLDVGIGHSERLKGN